MTWGEHRNKYEVHYSYCTHVHSCLNHTSKSISSLSPPKSCSGSVIPSCSLNSNCFGCLQILIRLIVIHDLKMFCTLILEAQVGNKRQDIKIFHRFIDSWILASYKPSDVLIWTAMFFSQGVLAEALLNISSLEVANSSHISLASLFLVYIKYYLRDGYAFSWITYLITLSCLYLRILTLFKKKR